MSSRGRATSKGGGRNQGSNLAFINKQRDSGPLPVYPDLRNENGEARSVPSLVEWAPSREYEVDVFQSLFRECSSSAFYVSTNEPETIQRYTDFRLHSERQVALPTWLPVDDRAKRLMPKELRDVAEAQEKVQAVSNAAYAAYAGASDHKTPRGAKMATEAFKKAQLHSKWNSELKDQESEEDLSDEEEEEGDYNDYGVDYEDEEHGGDEDEGDDADMF
eukprot:g5431.t1